MGSLGHVGSWALDKFHFDHLQPNEEFLRKARRAIDSICDFLKRRCFQDEPWRGIKVLKVVKGGSLAKGTAMKNATADLMNPQLSDADLVLFLNIFNSYTDQEKDRRMIIQEIERRLDECKENMGLELIFEKSTWPNPRVLQFKLRSETSEDFIEFDILPAYDALGQYDGSKPKPQVYVDLIHCGQSGEFSPCFTELQRDFIVDRPTKLKSLIRLMKHWYREVKEKSFPPKYALEILTVYAWEQGSRQNQFDMAEGFRTVLWLIEKHKELRIYWTKYYDFDNDTIKRYLQVQLSKKRPVILDPADPTANLGEAKGWDRLAEKAKSYAGMNCCRKRDGSLVKPWDVPVANEVPWGEEAAPYYEETPCGSETLGWKKLNGNALSLLTLQYMGKSGITYQPGRDEDMTSKPSLMNSRHEREAVIHPRLDDLGWDPRMKSSSNLHWVILIVVTVTLGWCAFYIFMS